MKWKFEISDIPEQDPNYPITGWQIMDNGVKRGPYCFTVDDFIKAIKKEPDVKIYDAQFNLKIETPALPKGTIKYATNEEKTVHRVTMLLDKKMWDIRYHDETFYSIGFPRMVIQYLVVPNNENSPFRITEMRIYAVLDDKKPITDDTPLYIFPYPNVSKGNAIVCWGQNERLELNSLVELERAFRWFVAAPFSEDHGVRTTHGIPTFKKLLEVINDQEFNDDWLLPLNKKFNEI